MEKLKKFISLSLYEQMCFIAIKYYRFKTSVFYKIFFYKLGIKCIIKKPLLLTPDSISIGNRVVIWNDARIEGVKLHKGKVYTPNIIIEDGVTIQQRCHITAASELVIGEGTSIVFDVLITDIDHEYNDISLSVNDQPLNIKRTKIGRNCFIGSGAKIQAGTILGDHCIVGANSVVRGGFPSYSVIAGVPAKVIKKYNIETRNWEKS